MKSIEDVVQYENHSLKQYTAGSETDIIRKAGMLIKMDSIQYTPDHRNEQKENRLKNWKDKAMNGQHLRQKRMQQKRLRNGRTRGSLKRDTESLIIAVGTEIELRHILYLKVFASCTP